PQPRREVRRHPRPRRDLLLEDRHPARRAAGRLSLHGTGPLRTERSAGPVQEHSLPAGRWEGRDTTTKEAHMGWTIVTGSDNAGFGHKSALKELLENDSRVEKVIDVGVTGREDGTYYPNVAVEAAEKIAA